ncbi:MAG TPA: flotillin-like protein FloA [Candidatus Hydrogenedentes bacterium]|nr:flotillin-like protein FloA [Candidatus Hydrogenedentota bacterium]HOV72874.1 flotillin-like protein FloA [Candidatus Hydrogenedentota bacterium]HPC16411.1 flotillin-like protein FloA [Candidatus Hydrogenedentota bacterium]HRT20344.1 flotillin-like protein FloA [Candidatus Hydrogenedentota bacterium]HRT65070.1 flotillin-like protein FloA [Candidatus Hydrogenedentota bacterium]
MNMNLIVGILGLGVVVVILVLAVVIITFFRLWLRALLSGASVGLASLVGMSLRKVNPSVIVDSRIMAVKAGLNISTNELETHYLAGGNVVRVVQALIAANKANIPLTFQRATAIDLAGRDVLDAVQTSVRPKVIDCPDPSKGAPVVAAVAMDGIQLKAKARVTVRTNINTLVGGATEETIIARVGEGIVTTIGSSESHKRVLENPDTISKTVLARGLDAGTAFEILSIDIADVDVGENIGAQLQIMQAEADKQIAQARAEERRAMARAREQEMQAQVVEMRARVVEAEAQVPRAIAEAFRSGNLGVMDYYRLKNLMSDTDMRQAIAKPDAKPGEGTPSA